MADYPREIYLDEDTEERLKSYLDQEIQNHAAERSNWVNDLKTWQTDYWAKPTTEIKTFPFRGAANIVIPLTAIAVEAVHARQITTMFALEQFLTVKLAEPLNNLDIQLERYLDHVMLREVDIYKFVDTALLTNTKLGSCVGKAGYERVVRTAVREVGDSEQEFDVVTKQGATADCVPLANFLMPFTSQDPQTAPWCGEEHRKTPYEVKLMCQSSFFRKDVFNKLERWVGQSTQLSSDPYTRKAQDLQKQTPINWPQDIGWYEIWLGFDVDQSERLKEIVVHYHKESRTIMSIRYNWHEDLRRPYRIGNYFPVEHRWAGIGVGKQNEQFQREITTTHRQRMDNATLANMRMLKVKKMSGISPNEPVFPGKIWFVDEMDDIDTLQMGEVYPSGYNNEDKALIYSQQRSGVNEVTLGMPQVGTPGTATSDLTRVQESNRKFDYTYKNAKRFVKQIALDIICNVVQFGVRDAKYFEYVPNGQYIKAFFNLPVSLIKDQIILEIDIAGQNSNRLLDRSAWMQLSQIMERYYGAMTNIAMMTKDPQLIGIVTQKAMRAATEAMKQIFESFDLRNTDRLLIKELLQNDEGLVRILGQSGAVSGLAGTSEAEGVGNVPGVNPQNQILSTTGAS